MCGRAAGSAGPRRQGGASRTPVVPRLRPALLGRGAPVCGVSPRPRLIHGAAAQSGRAGRQACAVWRTCERLRRSAVNCWQGLLDTDGTVVKGVGSCQFAVTNKKLADSVYELIVSLGYRCGRTTRRVNGRTEASSTCYILNFSTTDDVFWLERKRALHEQERPVYHHPDRPAVRGKRFVRSRVCPFAVCRSTTTTTCTWRASPWSRRITRRSLWTSPAPPRSSTTCRRSSSPSRSVAARSRCA